MAQEDIIRAYLENHPLFKRLDSSHLELLTSRMKEVEVDAGDIIFEEAQEATQFYIITDGMVNLETQLPSGREMIVQTLSNDDILGWSWMLQPYTWHFAARAVEHTRVLCLDAVELRQECDTNQSLGYQLLKLLSETIIHRLHAVRSQMIRKVAELEDDVYDDEDEMDRSQIDDDDEQPPGNEGWL